MSGELEGRKALVTGAASGIGRAIAECFAEAGARVAVHGRSEARIAETLKSISAAGGAAVPACADLRDREAILRMCGDALKELGGIDIVVNNAAVPGDTPFLEMKQDVWDTTLDVNLTAPFLVTQALLPAMLESGDGGRLIYIASTSAKEPWSGETAYGASKAALMVFAKSLAREFGPRGITVNSICPGWVDTEMAEKTIGAATREDERPFAEVYDEIIRANMLGARETPQDVAELALFLASDRGRHVTAQAINVCAGLITY